MPFTIKGWASQISAISLHHLAGIQQTNPLGIGAVGRIPWPSKLLRSDKTGTARNCILHADHADPANYADHAAFYLEVLLIGVITYRVSMLCRYRTATLLHKRRLCLQGFIFFTTTVANRRSDCNLGQI